jgi:hypothetical protein
MLENNNQEISVNEKFSSSFRWNITGSIVYESLKFAHQAFLLKTISTPTYGLIGSIFSIIYLVIYLSKIGFGDALAPFLNIFTKNKQNFRNLFIKKYLLPQIPLFVLAAIVSTYIYSTSFLNNPDAPLLALIPLIIVFEGLRIFLRRFMHIIFLSKTTVIVETVLTTFFYSAVWIPYIFFNIPMTSNLVFLPYLFDSLAGVIIFIFMMKKFYKKLPEGELDYPKHFWNRVFKARIFSYSAVQVTKNLFTGNFLTPFFAAIFGLEQAGIFNLANHIAESIKSIMKVTILFSGNALLAQIKSASLEVKRKAFALLGQKLNTVIYPIVIFLAINYKPLLRFKMATNITGAALILTLIFLIITFMEQFFLIYEQFYIVEEQAHRLLIFKLLELALFYLFVHFNSLPTPAVALLGLLAIRAITFAIIAANAYLIWKIKPNFKIEIKYFIGYLSFSGLFYLLFS